MNTRCQIFLSCAALALPTACGSSGDVAVPTDHMGPTDVLPRPDAEAPADAAPDVIAPDVIAPPADVTAPPVDVSPATAALIRARPYQSRVPSAHDGSRALPLVVLLHGYSATGAVQAAYLGFNTLYESRGFLFAYPDGTVDGARQHFWNATDACCDFAHTNVDDVAYISAVIDDMAARYRVDPLRVYLVGHSNGGFMSHRMACDRANRVAAVVSLAGAVWSDPMRCAPTEAVSVLEVHGTADTTISYMGGFAVGGAAMFPSARTTVATWAALNHCGAFAETGMRFDYVTDVLGTETHIGLHGGCTGGAAELWTMDGVGHIPAFAPAWGEAVFDWLMAHPKRAR